MARRIDLLVKYWSALCIIVFFVLISSCQSLEMKDANTIRQACNKITEITPGVEVDLCISSLTSDNRTGGADLPTLARVAVDIARRNGTDTVYFILGLRDRQGDNPRRAALTACADAYGVGVFNGLADVLTLLGPSGPVDKAVKTQVEKKLASAVNAGPTCQSRFDGPGKPGNIDPELKQRNALEFQLCAVAYGLTIEYVPVKAA